MSKLKIGYSPLSQSLSAPGDRRRLIFWANARGHKIVTDLTQKVDVLVASENSDFNSPIFKQGKIPVIFDLIDAYLSPLNSYDDFARGFSKKLFGQISGSIKPFSHHIRDFCLNSSGVICSSMEQKEVIQSFNKNAHIILDSHDEIPFINFSKSKYRLTSNFRILWEGQPATIRGVKQLSKAFLDTHRSLNFRFELVTDLEYFQFLNRYLKRSTINLLKNDFKNFYENLSIVPWTVDNLVSSAQMSSIAVIPIDLTVPMQNLKPENRLLIMWRLGLPCLTSPSPAYARVARNVKLDLVCQSPDEWLENINLLLTDPKLALEHVESGQEYLRDTHSQSILLMKWDQAIESILV
jgi:hypothetical protein